MPNRLSFSKVLIFVGVCCSHALAADATVPVLTVTSPQPNAIVSGSVTVSAIATSSAGIAGVSFWVGTKPVASELTTPPYSVTLATTALDDGPQTLTAVARDTANRVSVSTVTFQVNNGVPARNVPSRTRVMPLGDSLTFGFVGDGIHDNDGGYRAYLWNSLMQSGFTNVDFVGSLQDGPANIDRDHEGHSGFTIDQLNAGVSGWLNTFKPNVVLLLIGINDIVLDNTPAAVGTALTRMATLLDTIRKTAPDARVIVSSLLPLRVTNSFPTVTPQEIFAFNLGLSLLIQTRSAYWKNISFVNMDTAARLNTSASSADYGPDGLHPSLQGYSKMAQVWYHALTPLLVGSTGNSTAQ